MALAASTAVNHQLLPSGHTRSSLLLPHAAAPPTAEPSLHQRRRASSGINLPATISNFLHLQFAAKPENVGAPSTPAAGGRKTPSWSPKEDISALRPELHGRADWTAFLDPLHPWLRREVVKYGELAQATYDGFDFNPFSEYCGSCLFSRHRLLDQLGLSRHGYDVTKYLYAMSHVSLPHWLERSVHADAWSRDSNWMGFVAVSNDEESRRLGCRDIAVAWRGTVAPSEWFEDVRSRLEPLGQGHPGAKVEHGFLSIYTSKSPATRYNKTSASEQVMEEIKRLVTFYREKGEEVSISITGHSLGGALALLNAYEAASGIPDVPVSVISFGAPRVGNEAFGALLSAAGVKALRVAVKQDVVPKLPGILFNEGLSKRVEGVTGALEWVYAHAGVELGLDVGASPFLKHGGLDFAGFHSLETYLHLVDGHVGAGKGFRAAARRDVALVNKACGMLRDELRVPARWYQSANKGLECDAYGRWVRPQRDTQDIPSPLADASVHAPRVTAQSFGV